MSGGRVEIVTGRERRRRWSVEEKLRLVAATYEPGACVKQVAAANDVYPGLLFTWRRQAREGTLAAPALPSFVPVHTGSELAAIAPERRIPTRRRGGGQIEIELTDGSRVRVDGSVSLVSLRRVLAALRG